VYLVRRMLADRTHRRSATGLGSDDDAVNIRLDATDNQIARNERKQGLQG
jgi:hypothetical protein